MTSQTRKNVIGELKDYIMLVVGLALYAFGFTAFILPEKVVSGGLAGVASLVYFKFGISLWRFVWFLQIRC